MFIILVFTIMNQNKKFLETFSVEQVNIKFHRSPLNSFQRSYLRVSEDNFHIMLSLYEIQRMHRRLAQPTALPEIKVPHFYADQVITSRRITGHFHW